MLRSIIHAYRDAFAGLPREVWIISAAMLINRTGSMVLAFLTLYLTQQLGWSISTAGTIFSVYGLGSISGVYAGGKLVKRLGAVRIQIAGLIGASPCYLAIPFFETWWGVAISVFWMAFFSEMVRPANNIAIAQFTSLEQRTQAYGLQRMAVNLGFSIGPAIGGLLTLIDYFWLFAVDACFSMLGGIFLISRFGFRRHSKHGDQAAKQQSSERLNSTGSPLRDRLFLSFLGLYLMVMLIFYQFTVVYPKYMTDHYGMDESQIGFLYAINTLIIVAFEMIFLRSVGRYRLLSMIACGTAITCLGFGILPWGQAVWLAIGSMILITLGEMLLLPLATAFAAERSNGRDQPTYMSYYAMTYSLAAILAPLIGSAMYEIDRNRIWYFALATGGATFFGFMAVGRRHAMQRSE